MGLLDFLSSKDRTLRARAAAALYAAAVAQARAPALYTALGAPDTLEGRFELIALHVHLLCRRLGKAGGAGSALAQALFDTMFRDMDRNLRELGVGDPSMPRRIKTMLEAYFGRIKAYDAAFAQGGGALAQAIARNVYNAAAPGAAAPGAVALADYVQRAAAALDAADAETLMKGEVAFAQIAPSSAKSSGL